MTVIFIQDLYTNVILAVKKEWFTTKNLCELYDDYGRLVDNNHDEYNGECSCDVVMAYNYYDGSNMKSIVLDGDHYTIIDDDILTEVIEKMKFTHKTTWIDHYSYKEWHVTQSMWQGDWELYRLEHD